MSIHSIDNLTFCLCQFCKAPIIISEYREGKNEGNGVRSLGLYFTKCPKCDADGGTFTEDHRYFTHEHANHAIGANVVTGATGTPKLTEKCRICSAPISVKQAQRSFGKLGKAVCLHCEGEF